MQIRRWLGVLVLLLSGVGGLSAQDRADADAFEARVWLDRGDEPLLQRGDRVRIYYRTSADAYVAIFQIDTDGSVRLLHPRAPGDEHYVRAGRDYRLLFPQTSYWYVDEYPGEGYFFVLASPQPFDFSAFDYAPHERGWDLTRVGRAVYQDPYVAIDEYVARLIPDWESALYALDFIAYDVGERHDYPRFLCYDCHGFRAYSAWNPYTYACSSFRVVIWDDPYFYPAYRYRGTRVVFAQPPRGIARFEFKERAAGEAWSPVVRTRQPPLRRPVEYAEPAVAAPGTPVWTPPQRRVSPSDPVRDSGIISGRTATPPASGAAPSTRPGGEQQPTGTARPSERPTTTIPGRTSASPPGRSVTPVEPGNPSTEPRATQPRTAQPGTSSTPPRSDERPVLQRRPSTSAQPPRSGGGGTTVVRPPSGNAKPPARPSGGQERMTVPSRPSASSPARPGSSRPTVRQAPPSSGSRPSASPSRPAAKPAVKRPEKPPAKPGGDRRPPPRKPGGGL